MIEYPLHRGLGERLFCASPEQLVYLYLTNTVNYITSHIFLFLLTDRKKVTNLRSPFTVCIGFYSINVNLSPGTFTFINLSFSLPQLSSQLKTFYFSTLCVSSWNALNCFWNNAKHTVRFCLLVGLLKEEWSVKIKSLQPVIAKNPKVSEIRRWVEEKMKRTGNFYKRMDFGKHLKLKSISIRESKVGFDQPVPEGKRLVGNRSSYKKQTKAVYSCIYQRLFCTKKREQAYTYHIWLL